MNRFKHIHLSTRYDRSADVLRRVVASYIRNGASLLTFTEVDSEKREKVLRQFEGYGFIAGDKTGRDDCGIMWNEEEWEVIHAKTFNVAEYMAGNIGAALVVLKHKTSRKKIVVSVVHLPSAVEGSGRVEGGRAAEWYLARRNWVSTTKKIAKRFGVRSILLVADWNLDLKKAWVRALIKSQHPKWKWVWKTFPTVGTHGNRLIDFTLFKGPLRVVERPQIHGITKASDHRAYEETFAFNLQK